MIRVLKTDIKIGSDFANFIHYFSKKSKNGFGWQLYRSHDRNKKLQIRGVIISGKLTNSAIGIALSNDSNLILTIEPISFKDLGYYDDDKIDILYKNDIFVFSFGSNWIFQSIYGRKILSKVLGGNKSHNWTSSIQIPHLYIALENYTNVSSVLTRLKGFGLWLPPKIGSKPHDVIVDNILVIDGNIDPIALDANLPTMIISTVIDSKFVDYCWKKQIILAWIHKDQLLDEIAREFAFYIGHHTMPIKNCFSPIQPQFITTINE